MAKRERRGYSRREFLRRAGAVASGVALGGMAGRSNGQATAGGDGAFTVSIIWSPNDRIATSAPVQWAIGHLSDVLKARGVISSGDRRDMQIFVQANAGLDATKQDKYATEEVAFLADPGVLAGRGPGKDRVVTGGDSLGLVYGLTELADRVTHAGPGAAAVRESLQLSALTREKPASGIRGIFRMFVSEREDKGWFYDRAGWEKYFDMLVTNRFNRFNLSFGLSYDFSNGLTDTYTFFMYPFFVDVPGYSVKAVAKGGAPLPAEEMKKNLETLKFISDQAALRGLQFNLGIWTHNYKWTASPNATHTIEGLNAQTQAPYSRDAMKMIIEACPGITGITLRTHGESGVPEGSYDLWKIIMSGVMGHKNADGSARVIEVDMHGKTMTKEMIETAESTGMPVTISCKFWAEHMGLPYVQASIREAEMPKGRDAGGLMALSNGTRSFLRYGVGDLLQKGRKYKVIHRVWPGTQRLLLWGDPVYAAEMGRAASFAGMDGIEYFEPLSFKGRAGSSMNIPAAPDRSGYKNDALRAERDWEKYLYTFRLLGRLSYNPETDKEVWQRQLKSEFGDKAMRFEVALANASRILPLITTAHLPAAANFQYWPEIYVNQSIHNPNNNTYSEAPQPRVLGNVSSLDPQMFSTVNEYVGSLLAAKPLAKMSPLDVSRQLDEWSAMAALNVAVAVGERTLGEVAAELAKGDNKNRGLFDASMVLNIGQFFAHKLRSAALWQLFNLSGHEPARAAAIGEYKEARDAWASLAEKGTSVYRDDLTFGPERQLRRSWADRLADIDADIAGMATRGPNVRGAGYLPATIDKLVQSIVSPPEKGIEAAARPTHTPQANFKAGEAVRLWVGQSAGGTLHYRHLHQGERYTAVALEKTNAGSAAIVPAAFTDSPFPLQYYFVIGDKMFPGFKKDFTGTPYFVVMPA